MTQIEVAGISGVPYSTLRAIERAHVNEPCFFAVMDICAAIGLKPTKLEALLRQRHSRTTRSRAGGQTLSAKALPERSLGAATEAVAGNDVKAPDQDL